MFDHILVVCAGNICRSPIAERMLQRELADKQVISAGLITEKSHIVGNSAYPPMIDVANQIGITLTDHKAQQLTQALCDWSDLILVMEHAHIDSMASQFKQVRNKTFLLGQWASGSIDDPFGQGLMACIESSHKIEQACQGWVKRLSA
ncbi:low molecular weight phosphotyrosine protein phosphatase [Vibrio sp. AK197]